MIRRLIRTALVHAIGGILILGYSMEYYFHLREYPTIHVILCKMY